MHTTSGKITDLRNRIDEAVHDGSKRAAEKQHAKGKGTARERIEMLVDPDSFTEIDEFAKHRASNFGMEKNRPYGDGVVIGTATVDGRPIACTHKISQFLAAHSVKYTRIRSSKLQSLP